MFLHQQRENRVQVIFGHTPHLLIGSVLNGMGHKHIGRISPQGFGLDRGCVDEFSGGHPD